MQDSFLTISLVKTINIDELLFELYNLACNTLINK